MKFEYITTDKHLFEIDIILNNKIIITEKLYDISETLTIEYIKLAVSKSRNTQLYFNGHNLEVLRYIVYNCFPIFEKEQYDNFSDIKNENDVLRRIEFERNYPAHSYIES